MVHQPKCWEFILQIDKLLTFHQHGQQGWSCLKLLGQGQHLPGLRKSEICTRMIYDGWCSIKMTSCNKNPMLHDEPPFLCQYVPMWCFWIIESSPRRKGWLYINISGERWNHQAAIGHKMSQDFTRNDRISWNTWREWIWRFLFGWMMMHHDRADRHTTMKFHEHIMTFTWQSFSKNILPSHSAHQVFPIVPQWLIQQNGQGKVEGCRDALQKIEGGELSR